MDKNFELETIQEENKLNRVFRKGNMGPGQAYHEYLVANNDYDKEVATIKFQKGPRNVKGSIEGVLDVDLLEIVRDRLSCFQTGEFKNKYNEEALYHVEQALVSLNKRVKDRAKRNVLGTYEK